MAYSIFNRQCAATASQTLRLSGRIFNRAASSMPSMSSVCALEIVEVGDTFVGFKGIPAHPYDNPTLYPYYEYILKKVGSPSFLDSLNSIGVTTYQRGLEPNTYYTVRCIAATNRGTFGEWSPIATIYTGFDGSFGLFYYDSDTMTASCPIDTKRVVAECGFAYSTSSNPTVEDFDEPGQLEGNVIVCSQFGIGMMPDTLYHVRPYANVNGNYYYGEDSVLTVLHDGSVKEGYMDYLNFKGGEGGGDVRMPSTLPTFPDISYSMDRETWTIWDGSQISLSEGQSVWMRGINEESFWRIENGVSKYANFAGSNVYCGGNIMSIVDGYGLTDTVPSNYMFRGLFYGFSTLLSTPELPAMNLTVQCYYQTFAHCTSLTSASDLPAKKAAVGCYTSMYAWTSLAIPPKIGLEELSELCCEFMFQDCHFLTEDAEINAKELAGGCFHGMYHNCYRLVKVHDLNYDYVPTYNVPELHSSFGALGGMFYNTRFERIRVAAKVVESYGMQGMFEGNTALRIVETEIENAKGVNALAGAFRNCSSLDNVIVRFKYWPKYQYATSNWMYGVSGQGTFFCPKSLEEIRDENHIPEGWTIKHID